MLELIKVAWQEYAKFMGSGLYVYFAYASMVYLFIKDRQKRAVLAIFPAILLIIFFNPVFVKTMYYKYFFGTYWRLLWLLPTTIINAYTGTVLIYRYKEKFKRILCLSVVLILIVISGKLIYTRDNFSHRKNWYKIPRSVVEIGYNIKNYSTASWYPTVIVPNELYSSMRQYSSYYRLLYGRDAEGYMSGIESDEIQAIYEEMCKKEPDVELIITLARKYEVNNIIFNMDYHVLNANPEEFGCIYCGDTDNYRYYEIVYD
ncbi:MAG: hypothetical protein ACI4GD_07840 [Lachnospiraceae bacterium]